MELELALEGILISDYQCDYHGDYHGNDRDQKLSDNYHGRNDWKEAQTITTTGPETSL